MLLRITLAISHSSSVCVCEIFYSTAPNRHNLLPSLLCETSISWCMKTIYVHEYPPLPIIRYSLIQLSELEQCRMSELAKGSTQQHRFRTRDLSFENPKLLPLSHNIRNISLRWSSVLVPFVNGQNCLSVGTPMWHVVESVDTYIEIWDTWFMVH